MRHPALFPALLVSSLALAACGKAPEPSEAAPMATAEKADPLRTTASALKPLNQKKFGAEITEKTSTALDALIKEPRKFSTKTVRTEGVVSAVCKSMGCWMELADDAGHAHIKMAGHSFFVPKDASGHRAIVQGTLLAPTETEDECRQEAKQQTGKVAKIEIEATGVEFVD
jgi:hypothetical protein